MFGWQVVRGKDLVSIVTVTQQPNEIQEGPISDICK